MTQNEKNSVYLACVSYRRREREKRLKIQLAAFFSLLCGACAGLCAVISAISW